MSQLYTDYATFLARHFDGKVQKLPVDAGFSCPNRDGTLSRTGCLYCNNRSFTPRYCNGAATVREQLEAGKRFFARKYPDMRYLAYFQAHTNTYADLPTLCERYAEALSVDGVAGLVLSTRPDCVPDAVLDGIVRVARGRFVLMEYGVESTDDDTLRRLGRGHDYACAVSAIERTAARGIPVCVHLILGLPGEGPEHVVRHARRLSGLPVQVVKLHQLQVVRGTALARLYARHPETVPLFTPEGYAETVATFLEYLRPDIAVERFTSQSPADWLVAPRWGLKGHEFLALLRGVMRRRGAWQGRCWSVAPELSKNNEVNHTTR